jgi:hypothetical protein
MDSLEFTYETGIGWRGYARIPVFRTLLSFAPRPAA